jgi:hypothetical protein
MSPNKKISFRWLRNEEAPVGMEALARLWRKDHILAQDEALFRWQYGQGRDAEHLGFLVAEAEEGVVACSGLMVLPCHFHGKPVLGGAGAITIVDPRYREQALGLKLMAEADRDLSIVSSINISKRIAMLFRVQGRHVFLYPRYVALAHRDALQSYILTAGGADAVAERAWESSGHCTPCDVPEGWRVAALTDDTLEEWDCAWRALFEPRLIGVARHADYLRWRYLRHPCFRYTGLLARNPLGEIRGLAVCRVVSLAGHVSAMKILDFLPADADAARALVAGLYEQVPANAAYVEHAALGSQWHGLESMGLSTAGASFVSDYTAPPDLSHTEMLSQVWVHEEGYTSQGFAESSELYMTLADGDQERPN